VRSREDGQGSPAQIRASALQPAPMAGFLFLVHALAALRLSKMSIWI
jgi:hypothetical protein